MEKKKTLKIISSLLQACWESISPLWLAILKKSHGTWHNCSFAQRSQLQTSFRKNLAKGWSSFILKKKKSPKQGAAL